MNNIGIMQGRLSSPINGKIQSFPISTWEEEFFIARDIGFDEIEFIFEYTEYKKNPLFMNSGIKKIESLSRETGINVNYICADYFMEIPFIRVKKDIRDNNIEILKYLIKQSSQIGIKGIEIPLIDNSRIDTRDEIEIIVNCVHRCIPIAEIYNIRIILETSLDPDNFKMLLEKIDHPLIGANYDTGNSAYFGYDTRDELSKFGKWIYNVHIKDRILGGETVPLGKGDVNFELLFNILNDISYKGSFILQTARGKNDIDIAKNYLLLIKQYIQKYLQK